MDANREPALIATETDLAKLAKRLRRHSIEMTHQARASHIGSSLSMVEILAVLYNRILRVNPQIPDWPDRDRFILSKGHGCAVYYAVLAESGFFPLQWLDTFYQNGSRLAGHATYKLVPGIEVSTDHWGMACQSPPGWHWRQSVTAGPIVSSAC